MRYRSGAPIKLYVVVDQDSGDLYSFTSIRQRKAWIAENYRASANIVLATYALHIDKEA